MAVHVVAGLTVDYTSSHGVCERDVSAGQWVFDITHRVRVHLHTASEVAHTATRLN